MDRSPPGKGPASSRHIVRRLPIVARAQDQGGHDAKAGDFWVLTSIGVRYYGIQSEHEFIDRDDHRWAAVHTTWQVGLGKVGELQRTLLPMLFERSLQQQRALQAEQAHLATQKAE